MSEEFIKVTHTHTHRQTDRQTELLPELLVGAKKINLENFPCVMRTRINGTICYLHRTAAGMKEAVLSSGNDSAPHIGQGRGISLQ